MLARLRLPVLSLLLLLLAALPARSQADEPHPCEGLPIAGVKLEGCEKLWCGAAEVRGRLLTLTDIRPAQRWAEARLNTARSRLEQTGFFRAVEEHCQLRGDNFDSAFVLFRVFPNRWIHKVSFVGNSVLDDSELYKRLFLRPGRHLNVDDEVGQQELRDQEERLTLRYAREGFAEAKITLTATPLGTDSVTVTVTVSEGRRKRIAAIRVHYDTGPKALPTATEYGPAARCPTFDQRGVRIASGLTAGDTFTDRKRKSARRRVRKWLRQRGIVNPAVDLRYDNASGVAHVEIRFDRCYLIRFRSRHDPGPPRMGYIDSPDKALFDTLTFGESGVHSLDEAERSRADLEHLFQSQGYLFADVLLDYRKRLGRATDRGVRGLISFYVTRGYRSEIRNITITGASAIASDTLRNAMETKTYNFFGSGGYLVIPQMFRDLRQIQRLYQGRGFYRMRFTDAPPADRQEPRIRVSSATDGQDQVFTYSLGELAFRLVKHPRESVIYLHLGIHEGPLSQTGAITLKSPEHQAMRPLIHMVNGAPYRPEDVAADRARLLRYYQRRGHFLAQVDTQCVALGEGRAVLPQCDWRSVLARRVNIHHVVKPGPQIRVGEVFIRGTERTQIDLIKRELPKSGSLIDPPKLDKAEERIRELGVFDRVDITTIGLDESPPRARVAVVVQVHEDAAQFLEVSGGIEPVTVAGATGGTQRKEANLQWLADGTTNFLSVTDMTLRGPNTNVPMNLPDFLVTAGVTYRHRNFLGRALEFEVPFRWGFSLPDDITGQELGRAAGRLFELRPKIYQPIRIDNLKIRLSYGVFGRYDTALDAFDEWEAGVSGSAATTVWRNRLRLSATTSVSAIKASELGFPDGLGIGPIASPKAEVNLSATIDMLDNPIHPTEGFSVSTNVKYLFSDDPSSGSANFFKLEAAATGVFNIRRFLIVAMFARFATALAPNPDDQGQPLPKHERYLLGGTFGIRGIPDTLVYVVDNNGNPAKFVDPEDGIQKVFLGGNTSVSGTLELRVPIPIIPSDAIQLWLGGFFDWGALAFSPSALTPESIRMTAGTGLRMLVSGIPVRVDVGFNLDRRCNAPELGQPAERGGRCTAGREPLFDIQAGLLYTF